MHTFYSLDIETLKRQPMLKRIAILCVIVNLMSCTEDKTSTVQDKVSNEDYTQYVNPFIGTSKMGHVFPGATAPFGMVQLGLSMAIRL